MNSDIKLVQPNGMLASNQVSQFRQSLDEAVKTASTVLVDLKDVSFMDSSGLGVLVSALKTSRSIGKRLCICSINAQVRILFELTSMDQIFEIFQNQEEFYNTVQADIPS